MKRFEVGARVVEPTYGLGSVVAVEDAYTRVQFDEHGVKKFLTSMSASNRATNRCRPAYARRKPRKKRGHRRRPSPARPRQRPTKSSAAYFRLQRHRHPFS